MGKVIVQASMSLDGVIADTEDRVGPASTPALPFGSR